MAEAARAYRQGAARELEREQPRRRPRPDLQVIPGRQVKGKENRLLSPQLLVVTIVLVVAIVASAIIGDLWLIQNRMRMLAQQDTLTQSLNKDRSAGHQLEAQYSGISNPQQIQRQAAENLNMSVDTNPEYLQLVHD